MIEKARKFYQEYVDTCVLDTELRRALKAHERVPLFIDNLAREFRTLPFPISEMDLKQAVFSMSGFFVEAVKRKRDQEMMSDIERTAQQDKIDKDNEIKSLSDSLEEIESVTISEAGETARSTVKV